MQTVAQTQDRSKLDLALLVCTKRAKDAYPGERSRIERGLGIALSEDIEWIGAHEALIWSSDRKRQYRVNGHCECVDAQFAHEGRCKHRWAKALMGKALKEMLDMAQWYAQYEAPDGSLHMGTATMTTKGWLFIPDDGSEPLYASQASLTLGGNVGIMTAEQEANPDLVAKVCGYQ